MDQSCREWRDRTGRRPLSRSSVRTTCPRINAADLPGQGTDAASGFCAEGRGLPRRAAGCRATMNPGRDEEKTGRSPRGSARRRRTGSGLRFGGVVECEDDVGQVGELGVGERVRQGGREPGRVDQRRRLAAGDGQGEQEAGDDAGQRALEDDLAQRVARSTCRGPRPPPGSRSAPGAASSPSSWRCRGSTMMDRMISAGRSEKPQCRPTTSAT